MISTTENSAVTHALTALEDFLDRRLDQAIHDVAHYPTPIARCDVQLTKLLEERSELIVRLDALRSVLCGPSHGTAAGRSALKRFLADYPVCDDAEEARLIAMITAALLRQASVPPSSLSDPVRRASRRRAG